MCKVRVCRSLRFVFISAKPNEQDEEAIELFQLLFPERRVVGVYSKDILLGGGNIHCITQQQCECV